MRGVQIKFEDTYLLLGCWIIFLINRIFCHLIIISFLLFYSCLTNSRAQYYYITMYKQVKQWIYSLDMPPINNDHLKKFQGQTPYFLTLDLKQRISLNPYNLDNQIEKLSDKLKRNQLQSVQCPRNIMYQSLNITRKANRNKVSILEPITERKMESRYNNRPQFRSIGFERQQYKKLKQFYPMNNYQENVKNKKKLNESYISHRSKQHSLIQKISNFSKASKNDRSPRLLHKEQQDFEDDPIFKNKNKNEVKIVKLHNQVFNF